MGKLEGKVAVITGGNSGIEDLIGLLSDKNRQNSRRIAPVQS